MDIYGVLVGRSRGGGVIWLGRCWRGRLAG